MVEQITHSQRTVEISNKEIMANRCVFMIPAELNYFQGHFPGHPVLPAVAIIDISEDLLRQCGALAPSDSLLGMRSMKIKEPIGPGSQIEAKWQKSGDEFHIMWNEFQSDGNLKLLAELNCRFGS